MQRLIDRINSALVEASWHGFSAKEVQEILALATLPDRNALNKIATQIANESPYCFTVESYFNQETGEEAMAYLVAARTMAACMAGRNAVTQQFLVGTQDGKIEQEIIMAPERIEQFIATVKKLVADIKGGFLALEDRDDLAAIMLAGIVRKHGISAIPLRIGEGSNARLALAVGKDNAATTAIVQDVQERNLKLPAHLQRTIARLDH